MTSQYARAVIARHRIVFVLALILALPIVFAITYFLPRTYAGTASLLLLDQKPDASNELTTVLTTLAKSSAILERVRVTTNDAVSMSDLQKNVKARLYGTILKISYTNAHPALAVAVPNAVVASLVSYYNNLASTQYNSSTTRLQSALEQKRRQLHDLDARFQALSEAGIPVDSESAAGVSDLAASLNALQSQRIQAEDTLRSDQAYAQSRRGTMVAVKPDVSTNPQYAALAGVVERDQALLATESAEYTSSYPGLIDIQKRLADERSQLAALRAHVVAAQAGPTEADIIAADGTARAGALVAADHAKVDAIDAQITDLETRSNKLIGSRVVIETLKAERESVLAQFTALSSSLATALASRAIAENYGTLSVIDRATFADVAGLNPKILAFLDILIALALAFGASLIAEQIDPRVAVIREHEPEYGRPILTPK